MFTAELLLPSIAVSTLASGAVRHGDEPKALIAARVCRGWRRRPAAVQPGRAARCISQRKAGCGDDHVRHGGVLGAGGGPTRRVNITDNYMAGNGSLRQRAGGLLRFLLSRSCSIRTTREETEQAMELLGAV